MLRVALLRRGQRPLELRDPVRLHVPPSRRQRPAHELRQRLHGRRRDGVAGLRGLGQGAAPGALEGRRQRTLLGPQSPVVEGPDDLAELRPALRRRLAFAGRHFQVHELLDARREALEARARLGEGCFGRVGVDGRALLAQRRLGHGLLARARLEREVGLEALDSLRR